MKKTKTYFNWSSGKDAALALHYMQQSGQFQIDTLLTTVNAHYDRVSMHGLRRAMLEKQAQSIGIPLKITQLPKEPSMDVYTQIMEQSIRELQTEGYTHCGFGDIFLEDLRTYREQQLQTLGISCHFPLWKKDTRLLLEEFIQLGFRAITVCIKSDVLNESFVGREINHDFIHDLPEGVDLCGENGEFHTFCFDGPIFSHPVAFEKVGKVYKTYPNPKQGEADIGFWFCDIKPTGNN